MDSIYSMSRGRSPAEHQQALTAPRQVQTQPDPAKLWADKYFGTQKYQGSAQTAPRQIYGGQDEGLAAMGVPNATGAVERQVVNGPNIQPDIPTGNEPSAQGETLPLQQAVDFTGQDMAPAGWKYEKPPEMPSDPTNDTKKYTPEHVATGSQAITYGMQNTMPAPSSPVQAQTQAADHDKMQQDLQAIAGAKSPKTAWKELKQDPFYKNSDFYTGLMNVGLAIMSGANPMQAFQAGQGQMEKAQMSTQLGQNRQALIDQGYAPASVEAAITSGDSSKLKMQEMSDQDKMQAENDIWSKRQQYSQDVAEQNRQQENTEWDRRNAINQANQLAQQAAADKRYAQRSQDQLERSKALIDYRSNQKAADAAAKAASYDFDSRTINAETRAPEYKNVNQWSAKTGYFNAAKTDMDQLKEAVKNGDNQKARAMYQQVLINAARGEVGDNRSLQGADLHDFASDPSVVVTKGNELSLKAGFAPTEAQISYLEKGISGGLKTADENVAKLKSQRIQSLAKTMDPKRATALVNRAYGGGWHDPLNAFDTQVTQSDKVGALSSGNPDLNGF